MQNFESSYKEILSKLEATRRKENLLLFLSGLSKSLAITLIGILVVSAVESLAHSGTTMRTLLAIIVAATAITAFVLYTLPAILRLLGIYNNPDHIEMAKRVGLYYPSVKDRLTNALQLIPVMKNPRGTSVDLAIAAFAEMYEGIRQAKFDVIINRKQLKKSAVWLIFSVILTAGLFGIFSSSLGGAWNRVVNYERNFIPPAPFSLEVEPMDIIKLRGESLVITVKAIGVAPDKITLNVKEELQENYDEYILRPDSTNTYSFEIKSLKNSLKYFAKADWMGASVSSPIGAARVIDKPLVRSMAGSLRYPSYTGMAPRDFNEQNADLSALRGSTVSLNIFSNKELQSARVVFLSKMQQDTTQDTTYYSLDTKGNAASGAFRITSSGNYYVEVSDTEGETNDNPITYGIIAMNDSYPSISIKEPKTDVEIGRDALLPIRVNISDDYGFTYLKLHYKLLASKYTAPDLKYRTINITIRNNEALQDVDYIWDLNSVGITPEDIYEFYLEVADNDIVSGPKTAETSKLKVRLPSLDEVLEETEVAQKEVHKELEKIAKEAQELKKDMDELNRKLLEKRRDGKLDWKTQKEAENIMKKQQELSRKFQNVQEKLQQTTQKMQENQILSQETLQEFMELQKLMKEVNSEEFRQMQKKMQEAMKEMSPEEMRKAMEDFKFDEEQFRQSIDRTKKILKRLQAQQKADALKRRAEDLAERQDKLTEKMEKTNASDEAKKKELAKKQESLKDELGKLNEDIKDLEEIMKDFEASDELMKEFQKAQQSLKPQDTESQMEQSKQNMQDSKFSEAKQNQQKASQNLKDFAQQMQSMSQQMRQQNQDEAIRKMQKALSDLNELSREQESLKDKTNASDYNSTQVPELARKQSQLNDGLEKVLSSMSELSEKSFAVTPEMARQLGEAMKNMQQATKEMSDRRTRQAGQSQSGSMTSLNKSMAMMQNQISQMQQSGSCNNPGGQGSGQASGSGAGGMMPQMNFGQQMQQMAAQQQALNKALQEAMQRGEGGKLTRQERAEMGKLSKEQGNAKGSLDEMKKNRELPGGDKMRKEIDEISKEMQEVMRDIESGDVDENTLKKQERIMSRLLDASRSVNERDFEKKRESESGRDLRAASPAELDFLDDEARRKAIKELLQRGTRAYSKDYEALIRGYFESLNTEATPERQ